MLIQIISVIFLFLGLFLISADLFKIPLIKTSKALNNLSKKQKKKTSSLEILLKDISILIAKHLKLNEYKRLQLSSDLQTAGLNITPEQHIANSIIKAAFCGILTIPTIFIFPLAVPVVIAIVIAMYFKEYRSIHKQILKKREAIEYELPRLVSTIEKTLMHSRDVLTIIDSYRENAGKELKQELSITVADMRSGNYEAALTRLESRIGSSMLSDVVRGLISILRGDDTAFYWSALNLKFADIQRQILKRQAVKVPSKVKRLSMVLLFCFMSIYLVVIVMQIVTSLGALFV